MANEPGRRVSRRTLAVTGTGLAAGVLAMRGQAVAAQEATPSASPVGGIAPLGYVSMRMRPYETVEIRDDVTDLVIRDFLPAIAEIEGFQGYLVGDVLHDPLLTFGVTVLDDREALARSDEVARNFVTQDHIDEHVVIEETRQWAGDLLILGRPSRPSWAENGAGYYLAVRHHTSLPGTDPRDFVPEATSGFLPIVMGLPGFVGYLWFPVEGGFVALSLYDSEAAAEASTVAAADWAAEHLAEYTDGNPEVINATVVYGNMPIFER